MTGLVVILLLLIYWIAGQVLRRLSPYSRMCQKAFVSMGNVESLWYFMLAAAIVLLYV